MLFRIKERKTVLVGNIYAIFGLCTLYSWHLACWHLLKVKMAFGGLSEHLLHFESLNEF